LNAISQNTIELERFIDSEEYDKGINYFNNNINTFKNDKYANYLLGELGLESEDWETAKKGYESAILLCNPNQNMNIHERINFNDNEIYWASNDGLGVIYYKLGDYKKSLIALEEANKWLSFASVKFNDEVKHLFNLACAYSLNNYFDKSVFTLKKTLELNPNYIYKIKNEQDFKSMKDYKPFIELLNGK
jgi:tetratricopeptide (TPR) repeat protein